MTIQIFGLRNDNNFLVHHPLKESLAFFVFELNIISYIVLRRSTIKYFFLVCNNFLKHVIFMMNQIVVEKVFAQEIKWNSKNCLADHDTDCKFPFLGTSSLGKKLSPILYVDIAYL